MLFPRSGQALPLSFLTSTCRSPYSVGQRCPGLPCVVVRNTRGIGRSDSHHFCRIPVARSKILGAISGRGHLRVEMQEDVKTVLENPKTTVTSRENN